MVIFDLYRVASNGFGTFGVLIDSISCEPFAVTLEPPWLNNQVNLSCIPDDRYLCQRVNSPKFGNTFQVTQVKNRTNIVFHKGNIDDDTRGCILVGEQFERLNNKPAVLASKKGFNEFLSRLADVNQFIIDIRSVYPTIASGHNKY